MALRNQPYFPLYVQDFMTDEKLNECSAKANGIYIRLMCIMHKSEEYGTILLKQKYKQNEMTDKEKLYVRFAKELEAVSTYNDYRQRIQENAKKITLFSTFTEGGFAEKNIEKQANV